MKESLSVRFLYGTVIGRFILKLLVQPGVSRIAGCFLDSHASRFLIKGFQKRNNISMDEITIPENGFSSFNEFFTRIRSDNDIDMTAEHLISPCDGFMLFININNKSVFNIKHSEYSLLQLLDSKELADEFADGTALIFRLTPANYHRYIYTDKGKCVADKKIKGELHCVRPIAIERYPVYTRNSREYSVIDTENFGKTVQMEIGALLVGRIVNNKAVDVYRGLERGKFEFGGSTIVMLYQKDRIKLREHIIKKSEDNSEVPVVLGEWIGSRT